MSSGVLAVWSLLAASCVEMSATPASPEVTILAPRGGQRGTEVTLRVLGRRLADAQGLLFFEPGLTVLAREPVSDTEVRFRLGIALDCRLGAHKVILRAASGLSDLKMFHVGALPERTEVEPNDAEEQAQLVPPWVTLNGRVPGEDVDWFAVDMPAGERFSIEVESVRLGDQPTDVHLLVHGPDGRLVTAVDDTLFARMDPCVSFLTRTSGRYRFAVRESAGAGRGDAFYRLHVGTFPRPTLAWPPLVGRGRTTELRSLPGEVPFTTSLFVPRGASSLFDARLFDAGGMTPTPIPIFVAAAEAITVEPPDHEGPGPGATLGTWYLLGPFGTSEESGAWTPTEVLAFDPSGPIDVRQAHVGRDGEVLWRPRPDWKDGTGIDFTMLHAVSDWSLYYLFRQIVSPAAQTVIAKFGSDDTLEVRLNGKVVHEHRGHRGLEVDSDTVSLPLLEGANQLLVKVGNGTGGFGFSFRLVPPDPFEGALSAEIPGTLAGILRRPGERDRWRFSAKKGETLQFATYARRLRSPMDACLDILDASGKVLETNDDAGSLDSRLRFRVPADGDYIASVRDHLDRGSERHAYVINVTPDQVYFSTRFELRPGERLAKVEVPRGGRMGIVLRVSEGRVDQDVLLRGLPPGVTASVPRIRGNHPLVPVLLSASEEAPLGAAVVDVLTREQEKPERSAGYASTRNLVEVGNQRPYVTETLRGVPVAVTERLPFGLTLDVPTVPIVRGAPYLLRVRVQRAEGFVGDVIVRLLESPPGIGSGSLTIPGKSSEADFPLNAAGNAALGAWPLAVVGTHSGDGLTACTSDFVTLEVVEPYVVASLGKVRSESGRTVEMPLQLDWKRPSGASLSLELLGLPKGVTCASREIPADAKEIALLLNVAPDAPTGRHVGFLVRLGFPDVGGAVVHEIRGGELRVDRPIPVPADAPKRPAVEKPTRGTVGSPKT